MTETATFYRRSELARMCGVGIETLRYYESRGLISEPLRSSGNHRRYPEATVRRVGFIRKCQTAGFTLKEIAELISLVDSENAVCADVRELVERKVRRIDEQVEALSAIRGELEDLSNQCRELNRTDLTDCAILNHFNGTDD